jgi:hypothetical protein
MSKTGCQPLVPTTHIIPHTAQPSNSPASSKPPCTVVAPKDQGGEHKALLDALHRRKIDVSSEIVVVTRDGYIGARGEIAYVEQTGKTVRYVEVGR